MTDCVLRAKQDDNALEHLIQNNKGFILRCASRTCRRFITENDDEYEVAFLAFWEAVRKFDVSRGSFPGFAAMVIRRRLMDYFDEQTDAEIPAGSSMTWEDEEINGVMAEVQEKIIQEDHTEELRDEIDALGDVLNEYGFSFFDLAAASPKAAKTKICCARAVNWILAAAERLLQMRRRRCLPVKVISAALDIALKILERHRRYIIAAAEILDGDYPRLAEYLTYIKDTAASVNERGETL